MTNVKFPDFPLKRFQRLQWKLTISYLRTSVIVLCLLELLVSLISLAISTAQAQTQLESRAQILAHAVSPAIPVPGTARQQQFQALWELLQANSSTFQGYLAAVDAHGRVVVAAGDDAPATGYDLQAALPVSVQRDIQSVLAYHPTPVSAQDSTPHTSSTEDSMYVVVPLVNGETTQGALVIQRQYMRLTWEIGLSLLLFFGASAIIFFIGAGAVGLAFGVVTARSLVRRLQSIVTAVNGWSQGDFSLFVRDSSRDELGQLARRLNQMARQLQQLLRTRQDLATLEERNRLARDLHDSVKQQVFAVSLHISTTRALLGRDEQAAQTHLGKAEGLIRQAQRELTTLIRELRPVALEGKSLADALRDYARSWQEQTGIPVDLEIQEETPIAPELESAFFRIAQEGLANVARHSQAQAVKIRLTYGETLTLSISDNGHGFDVQGRIFKGFGLSSMRERVQALGGHIDIQSAKDKGTTLTVWCEQTERDAF